MTLGCLYWVVKSMLLVRVSMSALLCIALLRPATRAFRTPAGRQVARWVRTTSDSKASRSDASASLVFIKNTQKKYLIEVEKVKARVIAIKRVLGVSDFKVDIWFCSEEKIRELNADWREVNKSTDVLSFPANDFKKPGVFDSDENQRHLGDIVISPAYVQRQCDRDKLDFESRTLINSEDRGVSLAMSTTFSLEERISLLLVHSMVHLLGYDHETVKDWKIMTKKEDEVLKSLHENGGI